MATYRATGTAASNIGGGGTITPGLPTGTTAGDILVVFIETDAAFPSISIANWTEAPNSPSATSTGAGDNTCLHVWWRRATGDANDTCTVNISATNHAVGQMMGFYGCISTGSPWDSTNKNFDDAPATVNFSVPAITTSGANEIIIAAAVDGQDSSSQGSFTMVNANLSSISNTISVGTSAGNGGGVGAGYGTKVTAGDIGTTTGTIPYGAARAYGSWVGALLNPASVPANLKSYNTNLKANIKSINTNLISNVKTLNTNA